MRGRRSGKRRLLVYMLVGVGLFVFVVLPCAFLAGLAVSVRQERQSRPPTVRVPSIVGAPVADARKKVAEAKLGFRVNWVRSDLDAPAGVVVDQNPLPGASMVEGREVTVVVSASR